MNDHESEAIIKKIIAFKDLEDAIQLAISPSDTCIIAENEIYQAAKISPLISETLMGIPIRCYTPLEYNRYVAPYRDADKMIIMIDDGEKLTPNMKNTIEICRIMGVESIIILFSDISGELKRMMTPEIIPLKFSPNLEAMEKLIISTAITIKVLAEAASRKMDNPRAKDVLKGLGEVKVYEEDEKKLKSILMEIANGNIKHVFSDHMLMGVIETVTEETTVKKQYAIKVYRMDDHPKITMNIISRGGKTAIFTSEVEADVAKQIQNYMKMHGREVEEYMEKGDPIIAPLQLSINLFKAKREVA